MKISYKSNLGSGIIAVICSIIFLILIPSQIGEDFSSSYGVSSRTIPIIMGIVILLCGSVLIINSVIFKKEEIKEIEVSKEVMIIAYIGVLIVYSFTFDYSFLISTILLSIITLLFTKTKKLNYYIIAVTTVIVIYLVFTYLLHVELP